MMFIRNREYVGLKVYDEFLRVCDNCAPFSRTEYHGFVETLIRRDVNPDFRGLDRDASGRHERSVAQKATRERGVSLRNWGRS